MSRSSFGFRSSFRLGRKSSRDNRKEPGHGHSQAQPDHSEMHNKRQRSRHVNSDAEKAARSIFGDVPLTDTERRYLWAAQSGNLLALEMLIGEAGTFNLSCRDYLGRTALQLAVLGEHFECIQLLLNKLKLDVVEEGLLHAIKAENVKICDMFLSHPIYSDQRARAQLDVVKECLLHAIKAEYVKICDMSQSHAVDPDQRARAQLELHHGYYEQEDSSSSFSPDITPIVLAAQCNNFDIVHMLIQKGFTISTPHNYFCQCTDCNNHKNFDRVVHSKSRLNAYRGLASTAYLALSCDDPIYAAFELSRNLHKLAQREKEHKSEYRGLSDQCKDFAVELLDQCRTNEEVMAALHGGTDTTELSRIKMAIRYDQKKFIAHASCQEHLASMWYAGVPWFQHQNFAMKLTLVPLGILFIPLTAIVYVFIPYSKIGRILKSPFMKFMNYICSYAAFLVLLFLSTQLTSTKRVHLFGGLEGVVNGLIMFYVLGMFWAECKQLWEEGVRGYFSQMWNYMDITMLALYTAGYSTEGVIYNKAKDYQSDNYLLRSENDNILNPQILCKVLFSVANVLSFARMAYILPASETFGQLQISYGRMLQDVGKFIFIYVTVMIAFICGLTSLYSISHNANFAGLSETTGTLFWAAFGLGNAKAPQIRDNALDVNSNSPGSKAGRLNGQGGANGNADSDNGKTNDTDLLGVVEMVGYVLYGVYILGAVVVLINMLIAMMSNTFEEIQKSEDCEWKFARAKLWISFIEQGTTLPIPFNIIPTPKSVIKVTKAMRDNMCCATTKHESTQDEDKQYELEYKAIMHRVVLRFIHKMKFEKKDDGLKDELLDAREEIIYQLHHVAGRLYNRIELLERDVQALTTAVGQPVDGVAGSNRSSLLSYSRSVPSYPRDSGYEGPRVPAMTSSNSNNLRRGRSYYQERPRKKILESESLSQLPSDSYNRRMAALPSDQQQEYAKNDTSIKADDAERRTSRYSISSLGPGPAGHRNNSYQSTGSDVTESHTSHSSRSPDGNFLAGSPISDVSIVSQPREEEAFTMVSDRDNGQRMASSSSRSDSSPHQNEERNKTAADENHRVSRKRESSSFSPRWSQNVIEESVFEDHPASSAMPRVVGGIHFNPIDRGSIRKRRDTVSHPNIDAPFGHIPGSQNPVPQASFVEHNYQKPKKQQEALQNLILDVNALPMTYLKDLVAPIAIKDKGNNYDEVFLPTAEVDKNVSKVFSLQRRAEDRSFIPLSNILEDKRTYDASKDNNTFNANSLHQARGETDPVSSPVGDYEPKGLTETSLVYYNENDQDWAAASILGQNPNASGKSELRSSSWPHRKQGEAGLKRSSVVERVGTGNVEDSKGLEQRDRVLESISESQGCDASVDRGVNAQSISPHGISDPSVFYDQTLPIRHAKTDDSFTSRSHQIAPKTQNYQFDPVKTTANDTEDEKCETIMSRPSTQRRDSAENANENSLNDVSARYFTPQTNTNTRRMNIDEAVTEVGSMPLDSRFNPRFSDAPNPQNPQRVHLYRKRNSSLKTTQSKHHRALQFGREQVYPGAYADKHDVHPHALAYSKQQRHAVKFNPEDEQQEDLRSSAYDVMAPEDIVIPPMAANLQPFTIAQTASEYTPAPQSMMFYEYNQSKSTGASPTSEPVELRKKKSSLVSLVRGRKSDKSKWKQPGTSHNRSFSLNRYSAAKNDKSKILQPQRSKEI